MTMEFRVAVILTFLVSVQCFSIEPAVTAGCSEGWTDGSSVGLGCIYADLRNNSVTQNDAETICKGHGEGSRLIEILSQEQLDFLKEMLTALENDNVDEEGVTGTYWTGVYWIGLNDKETEGAYRWPIAGLATFFNWEYEEAYPDPEHYDNCVEMEAATYEDGLLWSNTDCGNDDGVIPLCQRLETTTSTTTTTITTTEPSVAAGCPEGWTDGSFVGLGCIHADLRNNSVTQNDAETICKGHGEGSRLIEILNQEQLDFLKDMLTSLENESVDEEGVTGTYWTGVYWIGLNDKETEGAYRWPIAGLATFFNWEYEEAYPDPEHYDNCVEMEAATYDEGLLWSNTDCGNDDGVIPLCQMENNHATTVKIGFIAAFLTFCVLFCI